MDKKRSLNGYGGNSMQPYNDDIREAVALAKAVYH